ncbi:MAG: tetratricopeptide repeat protein [Pyrinomonadaceae bacterium]
MLIALCVLSTYSQNARSSTAGQYRSIKVISEPSTKVWIDGVYYGKTGASGDLSIKTVASGPHTLKLRADGFSDRSIPLPAARKGDIRVELTKTTNAGELAFQEAERLAALDREKAVVAYQRAIAARPKFLDAYISLARVLTELGDLEVAQAALRSARRVQPVFPEATAVEGRIYKEGGEYQKAMTTFKKAITEGKGFQPEAHTGLGMLYKERAEGFGGSGDFDNEKLNYDEAVKHLKIALKQLSGAPDTAILYQLLGLIYESQKRYDDAIALYEEFLQIFPDSNDATAVRSFIVQLRKAMANPR